MARDRCGLTSGGVVTVKLPGIGYNSNAATISRAPWRSKGREGLTIENPSQNVPANKNGREETSSTPQPGGVALRPGSPLPAKKKPRAKHMICIVAQEIIRWPYPNGIPRPDQI